MKIFDAHCDVLYKLFMDPSLDFNNAPELQVNRERLALSRTKVQLFAIYVPESVHPDLKFQAALHMADLFYERIISPNPEIKLVKSSEELQSLDDGEVGAILTLEGCDAIGQDLMKLKTLLRLGVRSVGLTWNYGNYAADGALEERGAGLSRFGRQVIRIIEETNSTCDVSHLSERGFWDVLETGVHVFASHSNCHELCPHPRNLKNEQIKALIERNHVMGLTFVPEFLSNGTKAEIHHILRHLEHVCSLGGENHVGFGSDFDGIDFTVEKLESNDQYANLWNVLQKHYTDIQVKKFLFDNMSAHFFGENHQSIDGKGQKKMG